MKKTKQQSASGELLVLMKTFGISEELALRIGQLIVARSQTLFLKWKTNFVAHRETLTEMYAEKPKLLEVTN